MFGTEKDTDISQLMNYESLEPEKYHTYYKTRDEIHKRNIDVESLDTETYEKEFIYLSLILPRANKFARHEFTNFVPSCINPSYLVDEVNFNISLIIGHDFKNHKITERKKNFIDLPEIRDFIYTIHDENKEYFLSYIHGLFHESASPDQFSIKSLNERILKVGYPKFNNPELTDAIITEFKEFFTARRILK